MTDEKMPIRAALAALAAKGSVRTVADYLREQGVKGVPRRMRRCPLAVYLTLVTGKPVWVEGECWSTGTVGRVAETGELPAVLRDFVAQFDDGHLPELDADAVIVDA